MPTKKGPKPARGALARVLAANAPAIDKSGGVEAYAEPAPTPRKRPVWEKERLEQRGLLPYADAPATFPADRDPDAPGNAHIYRPPEDQDMRTVKRTFYPGGLGGDLSMVAELDACRRELLAIITKCKACGGAGKDGETVCASCEGCGHAINHSGLYSDPREIVRVLERASMA